MGTHTRRAGDLELVVRCDDAYARQAESLLDVVARFRGEGRELADGVNVQFGFSLLTLRRHGDRLIVCEPDYSADPFAATREDVTCTLAVLLSQAAVINRLGVEPIDIRFDELVLVARGCLDQRRVYMQRLEPTPGDSGWYVGPVDSPAPEQKADNFETLRVFQLLSRRAPLLSVMGLPTGFLAVFDGEQIEAVLDGEDRDVWAATAGPGGH